MRLIFHLMSYTQCSMENHFLYSSFTMFLKKDQVPLLCAISQPPWVQKETGTHICVHLSLSVFLLISEIIVTYMLLSLLQTPASCTETTMSQCLHVSLSLISYPGNTRLSECCFFIMQYFEEIFVRWCSWRRFL